MTNDENKLSIDGLTKYQVKMLDKMWSLQSEEEFNDWYFTLNEKDTEIVDQLKVILMYALMDKMIDDVDDFEYSIANEYLQQFMLNPK